MLHTALFRAKITTCDYTSVVYKVDFICFISFVDHVIVTDTEKEMQRNINFTCNYWEMEKYE